MGVHVMELGGQVGARRVGDQKFYNLLTPLEQARILTPRLQRLTTLLVIALPVLLVAALWTFGRTAFVQSVNPSLYDHVSGGGRGAALVRATSQVLPPIFSALSTAREVAWLTWLVLIAWPFTALGAWRDVCSWRRRWLLLTAGAAVTLAASVMELLLFTLGRNGIWSRADPLDPVSWASFRTASQVMTVFSAILASGALALAILATTQRRLAVSRRQTLVENATSSVTPQ
jgi:hypothetical protein